MENDLYVKYDSLCYSTFLNVRHLTNGVNYIYLKNFECDNKEHQFVIAIVNACYSILGEKELLVNAKMSQRHALEKKYKTIRRIRKPKGEPEKYVDVPEMLEYMRGAACDLCGVDFTFGDIYDAYYSGKEE